MTTTAKRTKRLANKPNPASKTAPRTRVVKGAIAKKGAKKRAKKSAPLVKRARRAVRVTDETIRNVLATLTTQRSTWPTPAVDALSQRNATPYEVLVSTLISLRTRDAVTADATVRLLALASTPAAMLALPVKDIAQAIFPAGFYKKKAETLQKINRELVARFEGRVPDDVEPLVTLPGVGRKTANLVVSAGHHKPAICVDVHVHRITNRWGYVRTREPDQTERVLRKRLPVEYWMEINGLLVAFGQTICQPLSPLCSQCPVEARCAQRGVRYSR